MGIVGPPGRHVPKRDLGGLMKARLPDWAFALLRQAGELADQRSLRAFVVGGFVRDLLLGRDNLDLDLVVEGDGLVFARALGREMGARLKGHKRFGTAVLIFPDGFKLDVAMARAESYRHPAALPTVQPSSIEKDLSRRDFTINTLAIRLNPRHFGELLDFYGGQRDLKAKTIRVLHDLSLVDDPTRVFRAIRFEQRYGFRLDHGTRTLVKGVVTTGLIARLSGHRLREELIRLCSEKEPHKAFARLGRLDLLRFVQPSLKWSPRLERLLKAVEQVLERWGRRQLDRKIDAWLVPFMALMRGLSAKAVEEVLTRLAIPARQAAAIRAGHTVTDGVLRRLATHPPPRPSETYRALAGLSEEVLLFMMAKTKSRSVRHQIAAYLTRFKQVTPLLTGADLKALGLKPGPIYKTILDRLLDACLNGEVKTEADERELVKRMVNMR
jgi:tRNA nucleotidyltransferase (CCA-adding enzyme)